MKLYNKSGKEVLTLDPSKEINRGGEGAIFQHPKNKGLVVKVYHPTVKVALTEEYVKEISKLGNEFIKPLTLYYNLKGKIAGFDMSYLDTNKIFLFSQLATKAICTKEGFDNVFKVKVLNNLRRSLLSAHNAGIIIGDLNPYNLFFSHSADVYFIDTDSYGTATRPHSGVMLPDIRDWMTPGINKLSDYFAFAVLCFQACTFVHPYKGIHKVYKSLEERVVRHLSLLSGDKDIIIPGFYEPLNSLLMISELTDIFQRDKRVPTQLGLTHSSPATSNVVNISPIISIVNGVIVRTIATNVAGFVTSNKFICYNQVGSLKDWSIVTCNSSQSIGNPMPIRFVDTMWPSDKHIFIKKSGGTVMEYFSGNEFPLLAHNSGSLVFESKSSTGFTLTFFDAKTDTYKIFNLADVHDNSHVHSSVEKIFVPSLAIKNGGIIQSIAGMKWLLSTHMGYLQTVRTSIEIKDVTRFNDIMILEVKENKKVKYILAKQEGMQLTIGPELDSMRSFAVSGNNILIPDDGKMFVHSVTGLQKIAEIPCNVVNEQSVLSNTIAGIVCQTGSSLYLLNKA